MMVEAVRRLEAAECQIRCAALPKFRNKTYGPSMHAKLIIVDNNIVIIGSPNPTLQSEKNNEVGALYCGEEYKDTVIPRHIEDYAQIWAEAIDHPLLGSDGEPRFEGVSPVTTVSNSSGSKPKYVPVINVEGGGSDAGHGRLVLLAARAARRERGGVLSSLARPERLQGHLC